MSDSNPTANTNTDQPVPAEQQPPFNEVSVLFPLLTLYTTAYMALMVADFALKGAFDLPEGMMPVYIALVGAYAADKEIRRWFGAPEPPRKGSVFVYLWMLFFLAVYIICSFRPEYVPPANLMMVALQVLGIFFGSKASKYIYATHNTGRGADTDRKRLVLDLLKTRSQITRQTVSAELQVSRATAGRLLAALEDKNLIVRHGEGKGSYYVLAEMPQIKAKDN